MTRKITVLPLALALASCGSAPQGWTFAEPYQRGSYDQLAHTELNRLALRLGLPMFWEAETDGDAAVDADELRSLLFHPVQGRWVQDGELTAEFDAAYRAMLRASESPAPDDERRALVRQELEHALPTLVRSDLSEMPEDHRAFVAVMLRVADRIDALYPRQVGMTALADSVDATDSESRAMFRRNWSVRCRAPMTQNEPACSAAEGAPAQPVDIYPAATQENEQFCQQLDSLSWQDRLTPLQGDMERSQGSTRPAVCPSPCRTSSTSS